MLTPDLVGPSATRNEGIIGEGVDLNLKHLEDMRQSTLLFHLTKRLLETKWRDPGEDPKLHLFGQLKRITRQWLDKHLVCKGGTYPAQLIYQELADVACERITKGIVTRFIEERPVKVLLDAYNPADSTSRVDFTTSVKTRWETSAKHCHVNWAICHSGWESEFCRVAESHPQVRAYVKNHNMGFEVPYHIGSESHRYVPDFIVLIDDGHGEDDPLHLVVEIKGRKLEDAKEKKATMDTYWVPGGQQPGHVRPLGVRGVHGRVRDPVRLRGRGGGAVQSDDGGCAGCRARSHRGRHVDMARKVGTRRAKKPKQVTTLKHEEATRTNIPTAEYQSVMDKEEQSPIQVAYERRNRDLDPQLVWRGKDEQDLAGLTVQAPPLFIQEKVHPKVLIDDLTRRTAAGRPPQEEQLDLFGDFNGLEGDEGAKTEFYQHDANWTNRMILGDSLQVMASLAEREGLRGQVQCIYIDPPYGIKFGSNFQWSTTSRDVKDGKSEHITREPEQVKAFRDTWRDGIHSYLTYLRNRLLAARDLLDDSGCLFLQIGNENVHRVRALLDEVFGPENAVATIPFKKTSALGGAYLDVINDTILLYARNRDRMKYRQLFTETGGDTYAFPNVEEAPGEWHRLSAAEKRAPEVPGRLFRTSNLTSQSGGEKTGFAVHLEGKTLRPSTGSFWKTNAKGMDRLDRAGRLRAVGKTLTYTRYQQDFPVRALTAWWDDTIQSTFATENLYVVQTYTKVIQRCVLLATDPGDLVLDPTCGSGTTAYVAEQWGRRWITVDTSRVALALARARIMGARYQYYLLSDSRDGQQKEAEITRTAPSETLTAGDIRQGFVYERVPHITLKSIANNAEIDVIWERFQEELKPLPEALNAALGETWDEWEIPREAAEGWSKEAKVLHGQWWERRIARQREIDASIAAKADTEFLYDKPYVDNKKVRVRGPFTVESLSPHRVLGVDENDELIDGFAEASGAYGEPQDFASMILENLETAGVQQAHKEDRITFTSLVPWPGELVCAEGRYTEGDEESGVEKRAAIFVGPEFGTVARPDLVEAAREAGDADFDVLIACAFNYDARSTDFEKLGRIPVLKARMNADLHMGELKNTGKGNLFVIFGEPDIDILDAEENHIQVRVNGVDVFHPNSGEVRSDGPDGIACWFIDTDYNEESFFVRQAYFLGANDPYKTLKKTLKAEIDEEAWATLHSDTSRPFEKPASGRIAVKVINHLGDEVMKVFKVE